MGMPPLVTQAPLGHTSSVELRPSQQHVNPCCKVSQLSCRGVVSTAPYLVWLHERIRAPFCFESLRSGVGQNTTMGRTPCAAACSRLYGPISRACHWTSWYRPLRRTKPSRAVQKRPRYCIDVSSSIRRTCSLYN